LNTLLLDIRETSSKNGLFLLQLSEETEIDLTYTGNLCSENTHLSLVNLEETMLPIVEGGTPEGFMVASTSNTQVFDQVLYLPTLAHGDGGWEHEQQGYLTPVEGIYYFGYSASTTGDATKMILTTDSLYELWFYRDGNANGIQNLNCGLLVELGANSLIEMTSHWQTVTDPISTVENLDTSFMGFLYEPNLPTPVAWSLHSFSYPNPTFETDTYVYYKYANVTLNVEWDEVSNPDIIVPVSGYYFLQIQTTTSPTSPLMHLCVHTTNTDSRTTDLLPCIMRPGDDNYYGETTLSASNLVPLAAGDALWVENQVQSAEHGYDDIPKATSFIGMLITEITDS